MIFYLTLFSFPFITIIAGMQGFVCIPVSQGLITAMKNYIGGHVL